MLDTLDWLYATTPLKGKRILLLVSGSIAVYKSLELVRVFMKMGAQVRVVMSASACQFVQPLSFEALSHASVLTPSTERWNLQEGLCTNHISYATWAHLVVVAPASANTVAKLAHGLADNVLCSAFLASHAPKILAPSMNTQMLLARPTQENLARLKALGCEIIEPRVDLLACNTTGKGAMAQVLEIVCAGVRALEHTPFWQDKEVVVTGGGSVENIDAVRCISNHSSGLQASALALALYFKGARVRLVSSIFPLALPASIECIAVKSAQDYLEALQARQDLKNPPLLFMLAAISDYKPAQTHAGKLKKQDLGARWNLECVQNVDILRALQGFYKIAFKAEENLEQGLYNAQKLLESVQKGGKGCAVVCLNTLEQNPFGSLENQMYFLSARVCRRSARIDKLRLSFEILDFVQAQIQDDF
ncbi:bifunctional phosphopantothenoylcysteine decarboxylase/phosphopantothenate--cysteine ligase CoaBC [Helicobacter labacensis]|uniref:bifunctional phosphopantothenoylcysteine decarboxylase/phosphopantothenate--cysteine ligase CoaBC n=1 Tax=Helicobacter labacensis TaxID=2316079 RepID=UPI000EB4178A|nr:bifunctional phosphopantothenoylcysteine decarboxylase/phosphopantothenate--cysteine ligase CoaBC [Helicobacter labacensis]